jgi:hypothetical protein
MKIMIIRHAEKPEKTPIKLDGVTPAGKKDKEDLIVQGWQRAGALARFFSPLAPNVIAKKLDVPVAIFAAQPGPGMSQRPLSTVTPLSQLTGITVDTSFGKSDETALATAAIAAAAKGAVLIAWQHTDIPVIVDAIAGAGTSPKKWPGDRFDIVFVLDSKGGKSWKLSQVPQMLLAGDSADPIK